MSRREMTATEWSVKHKARHNSSDSGYFGRLPRTNLRTFATLIGMVSRRLVRMDLICLALAIIGRSVAAQQVATAYGETKTSDYKKSAASTAAKTAKKTARQLKEEAERALHEERLSHGDTDPLPDETDEEHAAAIKSMRKVVDEVASQYPRGRVYETKYFLFFSNIPEQQVRPYVDSLDRMYEYMCKLYNVPPDHKVWRGGKAAIFAFLERGQFDAFEKRYFPHIRKALYKNLSAIAAICHRATSGEILIAGWRGHDPAYIGHALVHETSHGFNYRYKTKCRLPNWVDEGLAELVGAEMLPANTYVSDREAAAITQLARQHSFGGMFSAKRIAPDQYGMASSFSRFLLKSDQKSYARFIDGLKEGLSWPDALEAAYHKTPDEIVAHYGQLIGVPDLRP
jgi:hypothetical protein